MVELETKTRDEISKESGLTINNIHKFNPNERFISLESHEAAIKELEGVCEKLTVTTRTNFEQGKKEGYEQKTVEVQALLAEQQKEIENLPRTSLKEFAAYEAKLELLVLLEERLSKPR
jgi:hypothetical protein